MPSEHQQRPDQKTWRSPAYLCPTLARSPTHFLSAPLSSDAVAFYLSRGAQHLRDGKLATSYVNAVCPGFIRTPMVEGSPSFTPQYEAELIARHPIGRLVLQRTFRARSRLQDAILGGRIGVIWASTDSAPLQGSL